MIKILIYDENILEINYIRFTEPLEKQTNYRSFTIIKIVFYLQIIS